jgi:hypothetical protein
MMKSGTTTFLESMVFLPQPWLSFIFVDRDAVCR